MGNQGNGGNEPLIFGLVGAQTCIDLKIKIYDPNTRTISIFVL